MLPSPVEVAQAFVTDFPLLLENSRTTLIETFVGLFAGIGVGFLFAVIMDMFKPIRKALYPLIVITQTIPPVALAPLLVLWFGYEMTPKVILIVLIVFFPVAVSLLDGYESAD
jgi:ABC-type nitrate/sulfonate/bicarbonate transport system permease component